MFIRTKAELIILREEALADLVEYAGGNTHLALMLNCPVPTVNSWVARGCISKRGLDWVISHPKLKDIFTAERLRPDLYAKSLRTDK